MDWIMSEGEMVIEGGYEKHDVPLKGYGFPIIIKNTPTVTLWGSEEIDLTQAQEWSLVAMHLIHSPFKWSEKHKEFMSQYLNIDLSSVRCSFTMKTIALHTFLHSDGVKLIDLTKSFRPAEQTPDGDDTTLIIDFNNLK
jgi:hypothetical protein